MLGKINILVINDTKIFLNKKIKKFRAQFFLNMKTRSNAKNG